MTVIPDGPSVIPDGVSVIPDGPSVVVNGFSVMPDGPSVVVDGSAPGLPAISLFCCAEKKLHKQIAPYSDIPCWPYRTPCVRTNLRLWYVPVDDSFVLVYLNCHAKLTAGSVFRLGCKLLHQNTLVKLPFRPLQWTTAA